MELTASLRKKDGRQENNPIASGTEVEAAAPSCKAARAGENRLSDTSISAKVRVARHQGEKPKVADAGKHQRGRSLIQPRYERGESRRIASDRLARVDWPARAL